MPARPPTFRPPGAPTRQEQSRAYDRRRASDPALRQAAEIRGKQSWKRFREMFKRRHPLCCDPFTEHGQRVPTEDVHHVAGLVNSPELALSERNCVPLCRACHRRVEVMVQRGQATAQLFEEYRKRVDRGG
ncbi:MAG: hypothetical protein AMXMBFR13_22450 [Phycisphaerae bacterium]